MAAHLTMFRHGETDWNAGKRIQGQSDVELNERGCEQAREMASIATHFQFAAIYSSDLSRAYETARPFALKLGLEVVALTQLRERHLGKFQGWSGEEAKARWPDEYARYRLRDPEQNLGNGESLRQLQQRVITVCTELITRHDGEHIALITHAGVIDIAYRHALSRPLQAARDFAIGNASVYHFRCDQGGWSILPGGWSQVDRQFGSEAIE